MRALRVRRDLPVLIGVTAWLVGSVALVGYWVWTPGVLLEWCSSPSALWVMLPLGGAAAAIGALFTHPRPWGLRALVIVLAVPAAAVCCWFFYILMVVVGFVFFSGT